MQLLHADKDKVDENLEPAGFSFCKDILDSNRTLFYIHFVDENYKNQNINIVEMYEDNETISFNHILSTKQMKQLLKLVDELVSNDIVDELVYDSITKLVLLMSIEYKLSDKINIKKYFDKDYEVNGEMFNDILKGANRFIEISRSFNSNYTNSSVDDILDDIELKDINHSYEIDTDELEKTAINLNVCDYLYDPAIGREDEIKDILVSLIQGSCILVGEPGVGKTSLAEGIAYRIKNGDVPDILKDKEIYKISATDIIKGCSYVGQMEEKLSEIINEILFRENVILFFDEMHTAIGTGKGGNGTLDISNILKPYIDKGQIKMIGATTVDEYDEYISSDPAFRRRFEKIKINEPDNKSLYKIIDYTITNLEKKNNIKFDETKINRNRLIEILIESTSKSHRNFQDVEYNPGLALSILKKAFSYAVYYEHDTLLLSDIKESYKKCEYLYKTLNDKFEGANNINKVNNNKPKRKVIEFNKR